MDEGPGVAQNPASPTPLTSQACSAATNHPKTAILGALLAALPQLQAVKRTQQRASQSLRCNRMPLQWALTAASAHRRNWRPDGGNAARNPQL